MSFYIADATEYTGQLEEEIEERDPAEISEDLLDQIGRTDYLVEPDEIAAALETLSEVSGETVSVGMAITCYQMISYLTKQRGGRLPDRFRLQ